jgi:hypothetical protein
MSAASLSRANQKSISQRAMIAPRTARRFGVSLIGCPAYSGLFQAPYWLIEPVAE